MEMMMWEITTMPGGASWYVQEEGTFTGADDEVVVRSGLNKEEAMAFAAASGRMLVGDRDELWQIWQK